MGTTTHIVNNDTFSTINSQDIADFMANDWKAEEIREAIKDITGYYKKILKETIPYLDDYFNTLNGDGYCISTPEQVKKVRDILNKLKGESYGI